MTSRSPTPLVLMDTTLRDGEQTPGVAFSERDKASIARCLLCDVGVDRIEIGSALVSDGERSAARRIASWARTADRLHQIEMLGFCDGERSVAWVREVGVRRLNLLVKGSERHVRLQLGMTPAEHAARALDSVQAARRAEVEVAGVYLEDWSRGITESTQYVLSLVRALAAHGVSRFYLADTLGVLTPDAVAEHVGHMRREFAALQLEFHAHDDYGLATANCLAAARAGIDGLHTTVNGLGERAGNACLAQVAVALRDHAGRVTRVDERQLVSASQLVARASGRAVAHNAPIIGASAFTQTAGVHADGDAKGGLYCTALAPERFGRERTYALGKLAGRASLEHHLRALGLELGPEATRELLARVVALGDQKRVVLREDLPRLLGREGS